jgi:hypothetical protein
MECNIILSEITEWRGNLTEVPHELPVEASETKEGSYISYVGGLGPLVHGHHLLMHHLEAILTHTMTKELNLTLEEFTLGALRIQLHIGETLQYHTNMPFMLLEGARVYEDVIEEHEYEEIQVVSEGVVHEMHEGGRGIGETHRQHSVFI